MMRKLSKKGFSLIEVTIILGILGGISLMMMQMNKNSTTMQNEVIGSSDFNDLKSEVDLILADSGDCTASLKGVTFKGQTIQANPIEIELWNGDQDGKRVKKRFSSADPELSKAGKIVINALTFSLPNYTAHKNFAKGYEILKGEIIANVSKSNFNKVKKFPEVKKSIIVSFTTDSSGTSTIDSCGTLGGSGGGSSTTVISQGSGLDNQTGTEACQSVGARCAYVQSNNFLSDETGGCASPGHCMRACATFYNTTLPGVENGNGRDNIHSCDAKVGQFVTYQESGFTCSAYFHVVCSH